MSHEERLQQLADEIGNRVRDALSQQFGPILDEVLAEATADRERAVEAAHERAREEHAAAVQRLRDEHEATVQRLHDEHEGVLQREQASHSTAADDLRAAFDATLRQLREEAEEARRAALAEREAALGERDAALTERDAAVAERDAAVAERDGALTDRDAAIAERDQAHEAASRQHAVEVAAPEAAEAAAEPVEPAPSEASLASVSEAHVEERQADLACGERLLDYLRRADAATTLGQVLDALTDYVAGEAGRAALFLVEGDRLRLWRATGLEVDAQLPDGFNVATEDAGILAEAVRAGQPIVRSAEGDQLSQATGLTSLGLGTGRIGLALPVLIGGAAVAVLYGDAGGQTLSTPSSWPELGEVATRHAGRCLEVLIPARAAALRREVRAAELPGQAARTRPVAAGHVEVDEEAARRHARLLVSEIRLYNEAAVVEGRRSGDLRARLAQDIERARRLYEARIPESLAARARVFEDELVRILADGDAGLLGQTT